MDTTYFGKKHGIMLFKDAYTKQNLYWKYVKHETVTDYVAGINYLKDQGLQIKAIVCDGKRGLLQAFNEIPVQMCHFHQVAIVTRYITRKPRMQASKELKEIIHLLVQTDKESFEGAINDWYVKWHDFLNERNICPQTGRTRYIHKRLRSAYKSIIRNMPWLFTFYDHIDLRIPNTTNDLEGTFTALKNLLRNHNGLNWKNKLKFINEFFKP